MVRMLPVHALLSDGSTWALLSGAVHRYDAQSQRIATAGFLHGTGIHAVEHEQYQFLLLILEEALFLAGFGAFKIADVAADSGTVGG